jgi:hypothetical protein
VLVKGSDAGDYSNLEKIALEIGSGDIYLILIKDTQKSSSSKMRERIIMQ